MRNRQDSSASALGSLADATREYAGNLHMPNVSTYVSSAADQLDYLSDYVVQNDIESMVRDAGNFARRHPVAALGVAAVAGFGLTRMMGLNGKMAPSSQRRAAKARRARKSTVGHASARGRASKRSASESTAANG